MIGYKYKVGQTEVEQKWFDEPLFGCLSGEDVGLQCCLVQSCCCAGYAHYTAIGWANSRLKSYARNAFYTQLTSDALRVAAGNGPLNAAGQQQRILFADVVAAGQQNATIRQQLADLMFGVWVEDEESGKIYLSWSPPTNPCAECLIQVFFPACARCQEVSALMKWRRRVTGRPVRYNVCYCAFQELQDNGAWSNSVRAVRLKKRLEGENLLGRTDPYSAARESVPAPMPVVALRM